MNPREFIIITCPNCAVKNRVKSYNPDKLPVCAKCKTALVDLINNEAHSRYGKMVDNFYNLPDIGLREEK